MATLTRFTDYVRGKLPHPTLDSDLNKIVNFINAFVVTSPLSASLNANSQLILNPRFRKVWGILDATEFNTIQDAVDSITAGIIFIPPDTTLTVLDANAITLKTGVYIVGAGWSSVIQEDASWDTGTAGNLITIPKGATDCGVMNLKIDGQDVAHGADDGMVAIKILGDRVYVDHVWVDDWGDSGDGITFRNDGVLIGDSAADEIAQDVWVTHCNFSDVQRNGIGAVNAQRLTIAYNHTNDCRNSGIDLEPNSGNAFLRDFQVIGNTLINAGAPALVIDNKSGASAGAPASSGSRGTVQANVIQDAGTHGIVCDRMLNVSIIGNQIDSTGQSSEGHGIRLRDSQFIVVQGNTLRNIGTANGTTSDGISVGGNQAASEELLHVNVSGNVMQTVTRHGVLIATASGSATTQVQVQNNSIVNVASQNNNAADGVHVTDSTSDNLSIQDNRISDTGSNMRSAVRFDTVGIANVLFGGNWMNGWQTSAVHGRGNVVSLQEYGNFEVT